MLQQLAEPETGGGVDAAALVAHTFSGGARLDAGPVITSALLLLLLLALSFQRILGLDRLVARWALEWKEDHSPDDAAFSEGGSSGCPPQGGGPSLSACCAHV